MRSMCPISSMAVLLKRMASGPKPWSSRWKWKYMYWCTAASSSATARLMSSMLFVRSMAVLPGRLSRP